jgi:hypothetical protein
MSDSAAESQKYHLSKIRPHGLVGIGSAFADNRDRWMSEEEQKTASNTLLLLREACETIGIRNISPEIERLDNMLSYRKTEYISIHLDHLKDRIIDELSSNAFVHIPSQKLKY